MVDTLTPDQRSERMRRVRSRDTGLEWIVRRITHGMGYRYRLHSSALPGRPDLVFSKRRKVIFVHGCFWHRHDAPTCKLARLPKSRLDFWKSKLEANRQRDMENEGRLTEMGWRVLVVWECEAPDERALRQKIRHFLEQ
jgi:DNA mismatch endonuclease, patch repair protein